jgi:hypothetical protein
MRALAPAWAYARAIPPAESPRAPMMQTTKRGRSWTLRGSRAGHDIVVGLKMRGELRILLAWSSIVSHVYGELQPKLGEAMKIGWEERP